MLATLAVTLVPVVACFGPPAHVDTVSYARFQLGGEAVELVLELDTDHLMQAVDAPPPASGEWTDEDVRGIESAAVQYLGDHWQLALDGLPQPPTPHGFERQMAFDPMIQQERAVRVAFRFTFASPGHDAHAVVLQSLFDGIEMAHHHVVVIATRDRPDVEIDVASAKPTAFLLPDVGPGSTTRRLRARAIEGAATELAAPWLALFLLALLLAPLPAREAAKSAGAALATAAVAFALTHADLISPAAWAANAAAALSTAYLAAENRFAKSVKLRTATAALFGLVHGMALAPHVHAGALPPTPLEATLMLVAASVTAVAVALAVNFLVRTLRAFAPRTLPFLADSLLILGGAAGVVLAVVHRSA